MLSASRGGRLSLGSKRSLRERRGSDTYRRIAQKIPAAVSRTFTNVDFHIFVLVSNLQIFIFPFGVVANSPDIPHSENFIGSGQTNPEDSPAAGSSLTSSSSSLRTDWSGPREVPDRYDEAVAFLHGYRHRLLDLDVLSAD